MPVESSLDAAFLYGILSAIQDIQAKLNSNSLSYSDWIQVGIAIIAIISPFFTLWLHERADEKKVKKKEKEALIALHCFLVGNLNTMLVLKKQILLPLNEHATFVSNKIGKLQKLDAIEINKLVDELLKNKKTHSLFNTIAYPKLINISNFIDFVLINAGDGLRTVFENVASSRNDEINYQKKINSSNNLDLFSNYRMSAIQSDLLCTSADDYLSYTYKTIKKLEEYIKCLIFCQPFDINYLCFGLFCCDKYLIYQIIIKFLYGRVSD